MLCFFFFNDTATTEIYTLSLHDALPISPPARSTPPARSPRRPGARAASPDGDRRSTTAGTRARSRPRARSARSEEHTSELQSHSDLVCRLLLEKKKQNQQRTKQTPYAMT